MGSCRIKCVFLAVHNIFLFFTTRIFLSCLVAKVVSLFFVGDTGFNPVLFASV